MVSEFYEFNWVILLSLSSSQSVAVFDFISNKGVRGALGTQLIVIVQVVTEDNLRILSRTLR